MLKNYLRSIWQHLRRHPFYSFINLAGLSMGLFASLLLALFVQQELGYESMHSKAERIIRIDAHLSNPNGYDQHFARVPFDWINALPKDFPEVESLIRFQNYERRKVRAAEQLYLESYAFATDPEVFAVFDFVLLAGNPATALRDPYAVVLTESKARAWFGGTAVLGREIEILDEASGEMQRYTVTGVMQDLPANTHLPVKLLTSFASPEARSGWAYCYALLNSPASLPGLAEAMEAFAAPIAQGGHNQDPDTRVALGLMPITDIHLYSNLAREIKAGGNADAVWFFGAVAVLILLVAGFNFAQLLAARMLDRHKEAGVRKVLGSSAGQLLAFYALEAWGLALFAAALALGLLILLLPLINAWLGLVMDFSVTFVLVMALSASLLLALLAAAYPAWFFGKRLPLSALRARPLSASLRPGQVPQLRHALVTFQFVVCIVLLCGTLVSQSQFRYLLSKDLGYEEEQVLAIRDIPHSAKGQLQRLQSALSGIAGVQEVSAVMQVPGTEIRDTGPVTFFDQPEQPALAMNMQVVGPEFIELMDMTLLAGESFAERPEMHRHFPAADENIMDYLASGQRGYLLNEQALKLAGITSPQEAIGQTVNWSIGNLSLGKGPVIGVVRDFHQASLRHEIGPVVMTCEPLWFNNVLVRLSAKDYPRIREAIAKEWQALYPELPADMVFLDTLFEQLYAREQQQVALLSTFSVMAIVITLLGMMGMLALMSQRRSREFALRRVLGARQWDLGMLLGRQLLLYTSLALLLGLPLSWWLLSDWLAAFSYRVDMGILPFLLAASALIMLVSAMVWWQSARASLRQPTDLLRSE